MLLDLYGAEYDDDKWRPALKAVMDAEGDVDIAIDEVRKLKASNPESSVVMVDDAPSPIAATPQLQSLEGDVIDMLKELKQRNRIFGPIPTLEDLLNPIEEQQVGQTAECEFEGTEQQIVSQIVARVARI